VASLLADRFNTTQCMIAHALEKPKYHLSDLYWKRKEEDYNFSIQFIADIYSMNKADFIITSTMQEISGTEDIIGQYESYQFFTMPELCQVHNGINILSPKFNVVSPGVDEDLYFPYYLNDRRIPAKTEKFNNKLFLEKSDKIWGVLEDPQKRPVFTMARLDKIKNISGLVEAFGMNKRIQETCNLIISAGTINADEADDIEEKAEIEKIKGLIEKYELDGKMRWLPSINKLDTGEVYRCIADRNGMFVQPALFEAFGLTILEAMLSGLPSLAPKFGGPLEIIEFGKSGFLVNTSRPDLIAVTLENFIVKCDENPEFWKEISENGIKRVQESFSWKLYSEQLINLTKMHGFWKHAILAGRQDEFDRYSELIYHFLIRERSQKLFAENCETSG
jgi:sucrose synthase